MCHVSNEARALHVENEACGLATSREGDLHGTFTSHLVDVSIGADGEKVALAVLSWAVEGHIELE